jgi:uncharacterized protein
MCHRPHAVVRAVLVRIMVATVAGALGAGCGRPHATESPRHFEFRTGIALSFTRDLLAALNDSVPNARFTFKSEPGSLNVASALQREPGCGFAQADIVYQAYRKGLEGQPYPHDNLRGIAVMWFNQIFFFVRRDSAIHRIVDLKGKRLSVLPRGTSGEFVTRVLLEASGLSYGDLIVSFGASFVDLEQGKVDAVVTGYPVITERLLQGPSDNGLRLIPINKDVVKKLQREYPFLRSVLVRLSTKGVRIDPVETVGADLLLVCSKDVDEHVAYEVTKALVAALPALAERYEEAAAIDVEQAPTTPIPLHRGAARYYREREIRQ